MTAVDSLPLHIHEGYGGLRSIRDAHKPVAELSSAVADSHAEYSEDKALAWSQKKSVRFL